MLDSKRGYGDGWAQRRALAAVSPVEYRRRSRMDSILPQLGVNQITLISYQIMLCQSFSLLGEYVQSRGVVGKTKHG